MKWNFSDIGFWIFALLVPINAIIGIIGTLFGSLWLSLDIIGNNNSTAPLSLLLLGLLSLGNLYTFFGLMQGEK